MGYLVRVVGPAGRITYLRRGKEVDQVGEASYYPHPSNARVAATSYQKKIAGQRVIIDIHPCTPYRELKEWEDN